MAIKGNAIGPIKAAIGDKGYDSERSHEVLREKFHAVSIIPARRENISVPRMRRRYIREMKMGCLTKYHLRSMNKKILFVVEKVMSRRRGQVGQVEGTEQVDKSEDGLLQRSKDGGTTLCS